MSQPMYLWFWTASIMLVLGLPQLSALEKDKFQASQTDIFTGGKGGYHAYRIPSLIVTPKGAVLAICEARKTSLSDDGDIDLLVRRSEDSGKSWLAAQLIIEEGGEARIKFGNPTTVVDRITGKIWLAVNRDYLDELGQRQGGALILLHSDDDGKTWSRPIDVTKAVKKPSWRHHAFGPGIGIQITHGPKNGRLIIPANFRESFDKSEPSWSHVIYSDDHGRSWHVGGQLGQYTNECQVAEIVEDGRSGLLLNARNHWGRAGVEEKSGKRLIARSFDGGLTWSQEEMDAALADPPCQASLLRCSLKNKDKQTVLLFANPAGPGRTNLTIRASADEGHAWPNKRQLYEGSSAYSCLAQLPDGKIAVLYERDNYGKLTFSSFPMEWLFE